MKTKTIEERANKYVWKEWTPEYHFIAEESYIAGAKEQKVIDINKACEWLKENIEGGIHPQSVYGFADRFRKTLEDSYGNENTKEI